MSEVWQIITILLGGVATLAIFSFLFGENRVYRLFEHLFIGISVGWGVILTLKNFLWPKVLVPLFGLDLVTFPDGTRPAEYELSRMVLILPMAFGLLFYAAYIPRYAWLSKLVIGFVLGASGGVALEGFCNATLPQIVSSFKPLVVFGADGSPVWHEIVNNWVFIVVLFSVSYYFFFSLRSRGVVGERISRFGRLAMMVCFGAYFGSTVMARMALLVERIQFLTTDFSSTVITLLGGSS